MPHPTHHYIRHDQTRRPQASSRIPPQCCSRTASGQGRTTSPRISLLGNCQLQADLPRRRGTYSCPREPGDIQAAWPRCMPAAASSAPFVHRYLASGARLQRPWITQAKRLRAQRRLERRRPKPNALLPDPCAHKSAHIHTTASHPRPLLILPPRKHETQASHWANDSATQQELEFGRNVTTRTEGWQDLWARGQARL